MKEAELDASGQRREIVTAAARLAGRGREASRVMVVLADRPSFDEVLEVRRYLNEVHAEVAMSLDGDGTLTFRKATSSPRQDEPRRMHLTNEAMG